MRVKVNDLPNRARERFSKSEEQPSAVESQLEERDEIEGVVRKLSKFAGYFAFGTALTMIACKAIFS
jgi:hypothetical protein